MGQFKPFWYHGTMIGGENDPGSLGGDLMGVIQYLVAVPGGSFVFVGHCQCEPTANSPKQASHCDSHVAVGRLHCEGFLESDKSKFASAQYRKSRAASLRFSNRAGSKKSVLI